MKKFMLLFVAAMCVAVTSTTQVQAQEKGDMAAGVQFALGTGDSFTNVGLGAKFQWNVIDRLRLEPSFNFFFKKDFVSMWDFNANVHYQFPVGGKVDLYPLAGLSVLGTKASVLGFSASDSEIGLNLGGGVDFDLSERLVLNVEAKYKIGGEWSRFILSAGVGYKF